jgi:hypothetical protein
MLRKMYRNHQKYSVVVHLRQIWYNPQISNQTNFFGTHTMLSNIAFIEKNFKKTVHKMKFYFQDERDTEQTPRFLQKSNSCKK